ncbi:MAG: twin-arginine translocase subunit TatB [Gammaproteobacteria bacterium]|nr:twin-arginine translocase subunit TatB [Gammaproteobacteria bacterium]
MFDVGFSELVLILVVALVVVGPERLPKLARTAGLYLGRARRMVSVVKADVQRELAAEDLKRTLQKQAESVGLHDIVEETADAATAAEQLFKPNTAATAAPAAPSTPAIGTVADTQADSRPDTPHGGA